VQVLRKTLANPARPAVTPCLGLLSRLDADTRAFSKAIATGRKAARAMWQRTRAPKVRGQNESILDADGARLRAWCNWLRAVRRTPEKAFDVSPVFGAWQLSFVVRNFAPALQRVGVEEQQADGSWREQHSRHTIEFRAEAAKPRANLRRPFSVPVDSRDAVLRISVHGLGQVGLEQITLSNGIETLTAPSRGNRMILGRKAPTHGFPDIAAAPTANWTLLLSFVRTPV
jgi:hypothetical protein